MTVAVIDDGLSKAHPCSARIRDGKAITYDKERGVLLNDEFYSDNQLSHGTWCAALILDRAPDVDLYVLKIFDDSFYAHPLALVSALDWVVEHRIRVVNLSLGTTSTDHLPELREACLRTANAGTVIIAATHRAGLPSYPSRLPGVISVGKDNRYSGGEYGYFPARTPEFVASGRAALTVRGVNSTLYDPASSRSVNGTSAAAARMTANVCAIAQKVPTGSVAEIKDLLAEHQTILPHSVIVPAASAVAGRPDTLSLGRNNTLPPMGTVALYTTGASARQLAWNADAFPFNLACIVDPVHAGGSAYLTTPLKSCRLARVPVLRQLQEVPSKVDTLLVDDLDELTMAERKDVLLDALQWAVDSNKHAVSLGPTDVRTYGRLSEQARSRGLVLSSIYTASLDTAAESVDLELEIDVPVVAVLGTAFNQGKLHTQLGLRRCLRRHGYEVGLVGPNPLLYLIPGAVHVIQDSRYAQYLSPREQLEPLENAVARAYQARPHVIIVGSQGGVVAPETHHSTPAEARERNGLPLDLGMASVSLLIASRPDAVVVAVNPYDDVDVISRTVAAAEALGRTKVIGLVIGDATIWRNGYTYSQRLGRTLDRVEANTLRRRYERVFGLPVFNFGGRKEQEQLCQHVIESFSTD